MIYFVGILGFIGGFVIGQMVLYFLLRHKSNEDLLNDPFLKWTYGLANWIFAGFGSYAMVLIYKYFFFMT